MDQEGKEIIKDRFDEINYNGLEQIDQTINKVMVIKI
jgi:hypothetical protein